MEYNENTIIEILSINYTTKTVGLLNNSTYIELDSVKYNAGDGYPNLGAYVLFFHSDILQYKSNLIIDAPTTSSYVTLSNNDNYIVHSLFFPIWDHTKSCVIKEGCIAIYEGDLYINNNEEGINMYGHTDPVTNGGLTLFNSSIHELYDLAITWSDLQIDLKEDIDNESGYFIVTPYNNPNSDLYVSINGYGTMPTDRTNNVFKLDGELIGIDSSPISSGTPFNTIVNIGDELFHVLIYEFDAYDSLGILKSYSISENIQIKSKVISAFNAVPYSNDPTIIKFYSSSYCLNPIYEWSIAGISGITNNTSSTFVYDFPDIETTYDVTLKVTNSVTGIVDTTTETIYVTIPPSIPSCDSLYQDEYYTESCHNFITTENNIGEYRKLFIYDYLGNEINSYIIEDGVDRFTYGTDADGVYIVKIYYYNETTEELGDLIKEFPVYTFCNAEECLYNINIKLFCCDNACIDNCDNENQKEIDKARHALTRINATLGLIMRYVYVERNKYLGTTNIDATRLDLVNRVAKLSEILRTFVKKCKDCFDMPTTDNDSACTSC